ncbi:SAM-dependent methyltransferase [Halobiforma lacisalsi AJ5]|uniref:Putative methyltransferase n=1 Tax=Natronobacterium lacisalsi AJ5 TaxID=358396 RepID=M0LYJ3_NATLA|nr:class I SAM-dependent methyltransferase [Halobiforma lacisalsi]APW97832.1 SAM-dependent methyltransferase [Halobiforma lacisalsi AJ5]EMA37419.1 putative methyltransferase [Halobiforma lacisalsi AJ5]
MSDNRRENRRLWNEWSDDFQARWNADTADGELPPAPSPFAPDAPGGPQPEILETVEGKDYVELGCGGGQGSVGTAELGAETVVGVDFSGEQLRHARHLREFYGVDARFVQGDVTNLPLPDDRFDVASSEAVFQMMEDLEEALHEARRVLCEGGVLVLSVPHPLHEILDSEAGTLERSYFDTGRREITIDEEYESDLVVFDRTVADLHNALVDAGFDVRRLVEHRHGKFEANDPEDLDLPEVLWKVPQSVRFWAVAR